MPWLVSSRERVAPVMPMQAPGDIENVRTIPFFNYPALFLADAEGLTETVFDVLKRGAYIMQRDLVELEEALKGFLGVKHVLGVSDGTNAILLGLRAAGIGAGDEVILPSHTYIASAAALHFVGAIPVPVELGADHMLDPAAVEAAVTSRTRAIMPVQINGRTCDMASLQAIADRHHGLMIVEDAAQGLGSRFRGKCAGTFGRFGTFSFYPAKLLGGFGDGGALVTNDDEIAEMVGLLRDHGRNADGEVVAWGTNARLDNLQAAVLLHKFKTYESAIVRRRAIAARYQEMLGDLAELALPPAPDASPDHFDVYQNYELQADRRDELRIYLRERGIGSIIQWAGTPLHRFEKLGFTQSLPRTERFFERCLMLPMNTALGDDDVGYIGEHVRAFYGR